MNLTNEIKEKGGDYIIFCLVSRCRGGVWLPYHHQEIPPKVFGLLFLTLFPRSCKISSSYLDACPKLLDLNQDHPSKKAVFLVKSLWTGCYGNFSHWNAKVTKLWSHVQYNLNHVIKFCWWRLGQKLWRHNIFSKKALLWEGLE